MFVNRGIYHAGWTAVTRHSTPWVMEQALPALDDDVWELYGPDDWTQARDLAAEHPDKLRELQRLFLIEATKYKVLPLDDRRVERFLPATAGRPQLIRGTSQLLFGGMGRLAENVVLGIKNTSHSVTAQIDVPEGGGSGVLIAQGGSFGGWSLYLLEGRPVYCYNLFGVRRSIVSGESAIDAGAHQVRMEFTYDGGGLGRGGDVMLFVDGQAVGHGRVDQTQPMVFSADETTDVGSDSATPVSEDYDLRSSRFTGRIRWIQIDVAEAAEDLDHLVSPEERIRIAMARQ
jgi:arylsulfatase